MYLLDDRKEMINYWKFKEDALDRTLGELAFEEAMESIRRTAQFSGLLIFYFVLKKPKRSLKQVLLVQQPEFEFRYFHPQVKVSMAVSALFNVVVKFSK
jgi:hypothetical protein